MCTSFYIYYELYFTLYRTETFECEWWPLKCVEAMGVISICSPSSRLFLNNIINFDLIPSWKIPKGLATCGDQFDTSYYLEHSFNEKHQIDNNALLLLPSLWIYTYCFYTVGRHNFIAMECLTHVVCVKVSQYLQWYPFTPHH